MSTLRQVAATAAPATRSWHRSACDIDDDVLPLSSGRLHDHHLPSRPSKECRPKWDREEITVAAALDASRSGPMMKVRSFPVPCSRTVNAQSSRISWCNAFELVGGGYGGPDSKEPPGVEFGHLLVCRGRDGGKPGPGAPGRPGASALPPSPRCQIAPAREQSRWSAPLDERP